MTKPFTPRRLRFPTAKAASDAVLDGTSAREDTAPRRPDAEQLKWRKDVQNIGEAWSRLSAVDLARLESRDALLTTLIQERYGLTQTEAEAQVTRFVADKHASTLWAGEKESRATKPVR